MSSLLGYLGLLSRGLLLLLVQIVLFNNLTLFSVSRPFPYILILLYLPIKMPKWQGLLISFFVGFVIDIFSYSYGVHTSACVLLFFLRDFLLFTILGVTDEVEGEEPHLSTIGGTTFLLYTALGVLIHHLVITLLDTFASDLLLMGIVRAVVNTLFSLLVILVIEIIFFYKRRPGR